MCASARAISTARVEGGEDLMRRMDAHHHFWRYRDGLCEWMKDTPPVLHRDYAPADLAPLLDTSNIERTVLVQAAQTPIETDWLLDVAARTDFVSGVVGWVDPVASDAVERAERWRATGLLAGLRLWHQDDENDEGLRSAIGSPLLGWAAESDVPVDLLVRPRHLPASLDLVAQAQGVRFVIDHGAKPDIARWRPADEECRTWRQGMERLARHAHVSCKLSGLVTEAAPNWSFDDIAPYAAALLDMFGPRRLLWGSDWPVALAASSYGRWVDCCEQLLAHLPIRERNWIFRGNAERFYLPVMRDTGPIQGGRAPIVTACTGPDTATQPTESS